jgi:hypothetical protein
MVVKDVSKVKNVIAVKKPRFKSEEEIVRRERKSRPDRILKSKSPRRHLSDQLRRLDNSINEFRLSSSTSPRSSFRLCVDARRVALPGKLHEEKSPRRLIGPTGHLSASDHTAARLRRPRRNAFIIHDSPNMTSQSSQLASIGIARREPQHACELAESQSLNESSRTLTESDSSSSSYAQSVSPCFPAECARLMTKTVPELESLNMLSRGLSRIQLLESSNEGDM